MSQCPAAGKNPSHIKSHRNKHQIYTTLASPLPSCEQGARQCTIRTNTGNDTSSADSCSSESHPTTIPYSAKRKRLESSGNIPIDIQAEAVQFSSTCNEEEAAFRENSKDEGPSVTPTSPGHRKITSYTATLTQLPTRPYARRTAGKADAKSHLEKSNVQSEHRDAERPHGGTYVFPGVEECAFTISIFLGLY